MSPTRLSFKCKACQWDSASALPPQHHSPQAPVQHDLTRLRLSGFGDCVRWLAQPAVSGPRAAPLDRVPASGETHELAVRMPFHAEAGQPFWCLFQPALSALNGWSEYPDDIVRSALVRCDMLDVQVADPDGARIRAIVSDVLTLDRISSRFPPGDAIGADFWSDFPKQTVETARCGVFTGLVGSFEGDVTGLALFERKAGRQHLILEGYSDFHADFVVACNNPLDGDAVKALQGILTQ